MSYYRLIVCKHTYNLFMNDILKLSRKINMLLLTVLVKHLVSVYSWKIMKLLNVLWQFNLNKLSGKYCFKWYKACVIQLKCLFHSIFYSLETESELDVEYLYACSKGQLSCFANLTKCTLYIMIPPPHSYMMNIGSPG